MSAEKNYDNLLFPILHNEGQITGFLEAIFEFLSRRTDFFKVQHPGQNLGLPQGAAEELVKTYFCKYYQKANDSVSFSQQGTVEDELTEVPPEVNEVLVETTPEEEMAMDSVSESERVEEIQESKKVSPSDPACYNGAVYDNYSWSQSIKDLDVQVNVPKGIVVGKQVKVALTQTALKVEIFTENEWQVLVEGNMRYPINSEESFWTLVPNKHVHLCLEKLKVQWWDAFLQSEPLIDFKNIDATQPYQDLDEESQARIRELMYNEQQKCQGKPTIEQKKIADILKDAWDLEGSPFRGQPYDPNVAMGTGGTYPSVPR